MAATPFSFSLKRRFIDVYENAVSARTGNFLVDGPKETIQLTKDIIPESASFGVKISGDSMEPEYEDGQIRESRGLLQEDIASATGFFTKTISRVKRGKRAPSAEFMLQNAAYFNLLVEDVFKLEEH